MSILCKNVFIAKTIKYLSHDKINPQSWMHIQLFFA